MSCADGVLLDVCECRLPLCPARTAHKRMPGAAPSCESPRPVRSYVPVDQIRNNYPQLSRFCDCKSPVSDSANRRRKGNGILLTACWPFHAVSLYLRNPCTVCAYRVLTLLFNFKNERCPEDTSSGRGDSQEGRDRSSCAPPAQGNVKSALADNQQYDVACGHPLDISHEISMSRR